jgi:hypothetical protein
MRLLAKTSGFSEVIRLSRGAAPKPGVVMSFAIAVGSCTVASICTWKAFLEMLAESRSQVHVGNVVSPL